jgi:DNA-binding transcriptional LysR family regulator
VENRVLRYFVAVADTGSVTAASLSCHVSQPAISRQLSALEKELKVKLFRRTAGGLRLSGAGQRFLPIARDILARAEQGREVMRSLSKDGTLELTAVCPTTTMIYVLAPFMAATNAAIGNVKEFVPDQVYAQIQDDRADLAVNTRRPPLELAQKHLVDIPMTVQFAPDHRFAGREAIELAELSREQLIVPGRGSAMRRALDEAAAASGLTNSRVKETDSSTVAQSLAATGRGCALVIEAPRFALGSAVLHQDGEPVPVSLYGAWEGSHYAAPEIEVLMKDLAAWSQLHWPGLLARGPVPAQVL